MSSYLITGGCGFIGSHIAEELAKKDMNRIKIIDNLSSGYLKNIEHIKDRVEFIEGDIRDYEKLLKVTEGVDYIFHEAALVSVFDSINRPFDNNSINITGTLNVLQCGAKNKVKRVVIASSAAIYGNSPVLPKKEDMLPCPASPYGLAKMTKEYYGTIFSNLYNLPVVCLRYFNVYGPRQDPSSQYSGVISKFIDSIKTGKNPVIFGDGKQTRDFVYIKDIVRANILAIESSEIKGGEVFNIATGKSTDLNNLLNTINEVNESNILPVYKETRTGDIKDSLADITKAKEILKYEPIHSLKEGIKKLLD